MPVKDGRGLGPDLLTITWMVGSRSTTAMFLVRIRLAVTRQWSIRGLLVQPEGVLEQCRPGAGKLGPGCFAHRWTESSILLIMPGGCRHTLSGASPPARSTCSAAVVPAGEEAVRVGVFAGRSGLVGAAGGRHGAIRHAVPAPSRLLADPGCAGAVRSPRTVVEAGNADRGPLPLTSGQEDPPTPDAVTR
jgi:hypothetical protein